MTTLRPPWLADSGLKRLVAVLGFPALDVRFVGGSVRDALLGRPCADFDIGTPEPPEKVIARLEGAGLTVIPTGLAHGTVTAVVDGRAVEITSLRRDVSTDGRHATVAFTDDWKADAARRDFTMNALSLSPSGELYDYFKGASDARVGRLRFVGDPATRIKEDHLRLLRLFRFQASYGQKPISPALLTICQEHRELLKTVSIERVCQEVTKLLSAPNPVLAVAAMKACGILAVALPECEHDNNLLKLVMAEHAYGVGPRWIVRLAMLIAPTSVDGLAQRLKMSNADRAELEKLVADEPRIWLGMPKVALDAALYTSGANLVLARAVLAIAHGRQLRGWAPLMAVVRTWIEKPLPITGHDVMALGIAPGPAVAAALRSAESAWIGSAFAATREQLLAAARTHAPGSHAPKETAPGGGSGAV